MNRLQKWYCRSSWWQRKLESEIMPWLLNGAELGDEVLEVGPGPGLTTDWLQPRYKSITCIEVDPALARSLAHRTVNTNIRVQCGDATAMPYPSGTFSGAVSCTMLHHVPSPALQNKLFGEAYRVLRPGGVFVGADSLNSLLMRIVHIGDTMVLIDPADLPRRLEGVGFRDVRVETGPGRFRFFARRPPTM